MCLYVLASEGILVLKRSRVNERWRVALAGLAAVLAIPFLVIDSPSTAEGGVVESVDDPALDDLAAAPAESTKDIPETVAPEAEADAEVAAAAVVRPNVLALSTLSADWAVARADAVERGIAAPVVIDAPSDTNLDLLPDVDIVFPPTTEPQPEPAPETTTPIEEPEPEPEPETPIEPQEPAPGEGEGDGGEGEGVEPEPEPVPDPEPEPEPQPEPEPDPEPPVIPNAPAQVDGRVPPPEGGPTAAQWDALRRCESTHNYQAISPSGLYRGAYQFSQQTWDWVAGIHYPFLVGLDPINAPAGWQDVMAYTLYAMRGWDQWPICGKNLL